MYRNINFSDLVDISTSFDICAIGDLYNVSVLTNKLEGEYNVVVKITGNKDEALGRSVLFGFRSGEQLLCTDLNQDEQLIIPDDYIARLKESLSVKLELFGQKQSIWEKTIDKVNAAHLEDKNSKYQVIPTDLPIPEFKYENLAKEEDSNNSNGITDTTSTIETTPEKESFFKRLFGKLKKNQGTEAEDK